MTPRVLGHGPEAPGITCRHHGHLYQGPSRPGLVVDPAGTRTLTPFARDNWSTLRSLGTGSESPGKTGQHHGPSFTGPRLQAQLVDPSGPLNRARVSQNRWSMPQALRPGCKLPGRVGRPSGPSDPRPRRAGQQVIPRALGPLPRSPGTAGGTAVPRTREQVIRDSWWNGGALDSGPGSKGELGEHDGSWTLARVARESRLTPWDLGPGRKSSGTCGPPRRSRS